MLLGRVASIHLRNGLLTIAEKPDSGLAGSVWDCGELSAELFWQHIEGGGDSLRVLELGSGTGIGGIGAACAGAEVMLTDLSDALGLIDQNVQRNQTLIAAGGGKVAVGALDVTEKWDSSTDPETTAIESRILAFKPNVVLCADVTYNAAMLAAIACKSREIALSCGVQVEVLVAHRPRMKVADEEIVACFEGETFDLVLAVLCLHLFRSVTSPQSPLLFLESLSQVHCAPATWPDAHFFAFVLRKQKQQPIRMKRVSVSASAAVSTVGGGDGPVVCALRGLS